MALATVADPEIWNKGGGRVGGDTARNF